MASVHRRKDRDDIWVVRWRDPDTGAQRSKQFRLQRDAIAHGNKMENDKNAGTYIAPDAGKVTFQTYAEAWRAIQVHRPGTAEQVRTNLTNHVYPTLGRRPLGAIRTSEVQALVKRLSETLAPATVEVVYAWTATVFKAAVADRLIPASPCVRVKLPPRAESRVTVIPPATVAALAEGIEPRYRALIVLGAGSGVRISEATGLSIDRVDFLRRTVTIDRQLRRSAGPEPVFGPVKDKKNRARTIPVGAVVLDALAAHLAEYGPGPAGLMFSTWGGKPIAHSTWSEAWRAVAAPLGIESGDGYHLLRHFYASALIASGASVKEVQERLGHSSAVMTLDIYGHLWEGDDERTRSATDRVLGEALGMAQ
jgi:integrase